jgi:hypothetical protein
LFFWVRIATDKKCDAVWAVILEVQQAKDEEEEEEEEIALLKWVLMRE